MFASAPLEILLSDLHRAGVTDIVADTSFNFTSMKINSAPFEGVSPALNAVSTTPKIPEKETPTVEVASTVAKTVENTKPTTASRTADELVWQFGNTKAGIHVVVASNVDKGVHPLSVQARTLFVNMLQAIGLEEKSVMYSVLPTYSSLNTTEKETILTVLAKQKESFKTLVVGEDACHCLLKQGLMKARAQTQEFQQKPCGLVMHPEILLSQPALKKLAWHDLLNFQSQWEVKNA